MPVPDGWHEAYACGDANTHRSAMRIIEVNVHRVHI